MPHNIDELVNEFCEIIGGCKETELISDKEIIAKSLRNIAETCPDKFDDIIECMRKRVKTIGDIITISFNVSRDPIEYVANMIADTIRHRTSLDLLDCVTFSDDELELALKELVKHSDNEGLCVNFSTGGKLVFVNKDDDECGVGAVRKLRDGVVNENDMTCYTCPYFVPVELIRKGIQYLRGEIDRESLAAAVRDRAVELFVGEIT